MGTLDIDRVEPGAERPLSPAGILLNHGLERRQGELVEPIGEMRMPPVGDLEGRGRPRLMDGVDEQAKGGNALIAVEAEHPRLRTGMRLHGGDLDGDKACASLRASPIEGDHALRWC